MSEKTTPSKADDVRKSNSYNICDKDGQSTEQILVIPTASSDPLTANARRVALQGANKSKNKKVKRMAKTKTQKKASGKPKRALSGYNIFFKQERARILAEDDSAVDMQMTPSRGNEKRPHRKTHGKIGFTELGKAIGNKWSNLDDETKSHYETLARPDKDRYERELKAWKSSGKMMKDLPDDFNCKLNIEGKKGTSPTKKPAAKPNKSSALLMGQKTSHAVLQMQTLQPRHSNVASIAQGNESSMLLSYSEHSPQGNNAYFNSLPFAAMPNQYTDYLNLAQLTQCNPPYASLPTTKPPYNQIDGYGNYNAFSMPTAAGENREPKQKQCSSYEAYLDVDMVQPTPTFHDERDHYNISHGQFTQYLGTLPGPFTKDQPALVEPSQDRFPTRKQSFPFTFGHQLAIDNVRVKYPAIFSPEPPREEAGHDAASFCQSKHYLKVVEDTADVVWTTLSNPTHTTPLTNETPSPHQLCCNGAGYGYVEYPAGIEERPDPCREAVGLNSAASHPTLNGFDKVQAQPMLTRPTHDDDDDDGAHTMTNGMSRHDALPFAAENSELDEESLFLMLMLGTGSPLVQTPTSSPEHNPTIHDI